MLGAVFDLESRACCGVASSIACLGVIVVKPPDQLTDVGIKMELKRCSESLGPYRSMAHKSFRAFWDS